MIRNKKFPKLQPFYLLISMCLAAQTTFMRRKRKNKRVCWNFVFRMESSQRNHWKRSSSVSGSLCYHEHWYLSGRNHSVKVVKSSKTCLTESSRASFSIISTIEKYTVFENSDIGIRDIVEDLNTSYGSTQHILFTVWL